MTHAIPDPDLIYQAIEEDHRLEAASENTQEALARHRWRWTLDESNPNRLSFGNYAKYAGRSKFIILTMAKGYAGIRTDTDVSLSEAIARAGTGQARTATVEAIAEASGTSFQNVVKNNADMPAQVEKIATERALRKGTTASEELPRAAKVVVQSRRAAASEKAAKVATTSDRMLAVEGHLAAAVLNLRNALRDSDGVFSEEDREFLTTDIGRIRDLLNLLDLRIGGSTTDVDWDSELARLGDSR